MKRDFKISTSFLVRKFNEFNKEYFNGELSLPVFEVKSVKSYIGKCKWRNDEYGCCVYTIVVSDYYSIDEHTCCNVLLHEMIHLLIRSKGLKDTKAHHGSVFYHYAAYLNGMGWEINRITSLNGAVPCHNRDEVYSLVVFKDCKGKAFLMRYSPKCEGYFRAAIPRQRFTGVVWFNSSDARKYGSLAECRSAFRGRFISEKEYERIMSLYGAYAEAV